MGIFHMDHPLTYVYISMHTDTDIFNAHGLLITKREMK